MEVPGKRIESDEEENAENVDIVCEPCQSENITTQANGFCKDCEEFMCNTCFRKHLNLKLCKHHVLVDSGLSFLLLQRSDGCKISCKQHIGETVKYYCRTHEVVGCGDCIILEHKTCQLELIQDLSDNFQENTEYKSLKENTDQVIYERKCFEKEILDNKKDNEVMLEKAVGSIKQFRLDINEYLDKVESVVIAKAKNIMKENETLLIKIENECKTLSVKLEKITAMLNSKLFKDNALFIHAVECKPKVSESAMALSDMKAKTMKKYEFVPDQQLRSLSNTAKNLGTVAISFMNVCHQTTERANDEESKQKPVLSKSSSELTGKGVYKTVTEGPVPAPGESLNAEDKTEERMPHLPSPRQTVTTHISDSQIQSQENGENLEQEPQTSPPRVKRQNVLYERKHTERLLLRKDDGSKQSPERVNCSVMIRSPVMLDLIRKLQSCCRFCRKGTVEVVPIEKRHPIEKCGFSITGPKDEVEAITDELNEITRNARTLSIDLEIEKDSVSSFIETAQRLEIELPIIVKKGNTIEPTNSSDIKTLQQRKLKWIFPNGHTVRLVEVCNILEKKARVAFIEDTKQSAEYIFEIDQDDYVLLVPKWQEGRMKEKDTVHERLKNCLERCFIRSVHHVDVCIETTLGSWNKECFVKQLLVLLKEVFKGKHPCVCVCMYSKDQKIWDEILRACRQAFFSDENVDQQHSKRVIVTVEKGDLAETKADIIVNSVDRSGDLRNGAISSSIHKKAGKKLQDELNSKHKTKTPWKIFQTASHLKSCQYIFHGCLMEYEHRDSAKYFQKLKDFVLDCLKRSSDWAKTIAFPALGAGNLNYPTEVVINALFSAVESFNKEFGKSTTLTEVKFVLYDESVFKQFRKEQKIRDMPSHNISSSLKFGKVTLRAERGSVNDIYSDCILYLKEKSHLHEGNGKQSGISTSSVGNYVKVENVFADMDDRQSIDSALKKGLKSALSKKKKSVSIYFDREHPFLKLKDNLDLIFVAVADTATDVSQDMDVSVVIDDPYFEKAKRIIAKNSPSASNGQGPTTDHILINVVGMQNDVSAAVEKLRNQTGVRVAEIFCVQDDCEKLEVSMAQTNLENDVAAKTKSSGPSFSDVMNDSLPQWDCDMLQDEKGLELYVEMLNIPVSETTTSLKAKLFDLSLQMVSPTLVYCDGSSTAILICNSEEDAVNLSENRETQFRFRRMQKKVWLSRSNIS